MTILYLVLSFGCWCFAAQPARPFSPPPLHLPPAASTASIVNHSQSFVSWNAKEQESVLTIVKMLLELRKKYALVPSVKQDACCLPTDDEDVRELTELLESLGLTKPTSQEISAFSLLSSKSKK